MASKRKEKKFNDLIAREREKSLAKLASSPDLVNEQVNLDSISQSQESSNLKTKSLNLNPMPRERIAYSNTFCLCTDKIGILSSVEDCHRILSAFEKLADIICPDELKEKKELIKICQSKINFSEDKVAIETYINYIKVFTLDFVFKVNYICLIQLKNTTRKQLKYSDLKELLKTNNIELKIDLSKINNFETVKADISDVIENLSRVFPQLKLPEKKTPIIEHRLFIDSNLAKTSTSLVADTFFTFCISKSMSIQKITEKLHRTCKTFRVGNIEILLQEAEDAILTNYGEDTFKVFITLVSYWYEKSNHLEKITVSGSDILEYLNKKYQKTKRNTQRIKKIENLKWLAHQCELIDSLRVYSTGISPKGGSDFTIDRTYLIEFPKISFVPYQLDINGNADLTTITDLQITFKVGEWFKYFDSKNYCVQFGFIHKKALSSNGSLSNFLHWINIKSRQNQKGSFKIRTVLEDIGLKQELEKILASERSGYKARNLYESFNKMILEAQSIEDLPQKIIYNPPQWTSRKPNGWFKTWLNQIINIEDHKYLESINHKKDKPIKSNSESKLSIKDLKSALESNKDNPNVSIRKLTEWYGYKHPWLQRKLKSGKFAQFELKDLINGVKILTEKK